MKDRAAWVLTDADRRVWVERLELGPGELGLPEDSGAFIRKTTLRGGLSDGIDLIEVCNGALSFTVLPTRGMGVWRAAYNGRFVGWRSPARGPVHPKFVHANDRDGLGWLAGFDEVVVRCGLESNGAPGPDVLPNNQGAPTTIQLGLHGRIANIPAHYVEVRVLPGDPPELCVAGVTDEAMLFLPQLRLTSEISTRLGSNSLRIRDCVRNLRSTPSEMQLLYHCNFGGPFLDEGARMVVPASATLPRDARAAEDIDTWDIYRGPTSGYVEQCYWHVPLADPKGNSVAMLRNAAGDLGVAVRFNVRQLPCFTQWKNTGAESDGYVTGLEPATNYPNPKSFERRHGRVVKLQPGREYVAELALEMMDSAAGVKRVETEIRRIQARKTREVSRVPVGLYSQGGE